MTNIDPAIVKALQQAAWKRFGGMPSSNPSDYVHALTPSIAAAVESAKAEAWDEGYAARRSEDPRGPGETNPYRAALTEEPR